MKVPITLATSLLACTALAAPASDPDTRASAVVGKMTPAEKTVLTHGIMALPIMGIKVPADAVPGAGFVPGIARLGVPPQTESDASLGVAYVMGLRKDGATALPSGMAMGSTWNPELIAAGGAMIGGEARAKGFNVLLAGGNNLIRDPRNGRTFEYVSEDPLLSGTLAGAEIKGIQSAHIVSTVKHYALNDQETARHFGNVKISDAAARESDLLSFEIAIERGQPGSVMCAYNQINGAYGCDNDYLLNTVLKHDWNYKGYVMSDWGAVPRLETALHGLDQQSGAQLDPKVFFEKPLAEAAARDAKYAARLDDMNHRILRSLYAVGADAAIVKTPINFTANGALAQSVSQQGIVLLRNTGGLLPLSPSLKKIVVIGGYADAGVLSGAGSSQVQGEGGAAVIVPTGGDGPFAGLMSESYHRSAPLAAIRAMAPAATVTFRTGRYISEAVTAARGADAVIIFATQWMTEGLDVGDLSLPHGQEELITAVAAANPRTVVVLETGGPVLTPWSDKTAAVLEAWYPGARGGPAIASVLFGETNPSGRLPVTFPAALSQLPRPDLPGFDTVDPDFQGNGRPGQTLSIDYDIEGSDIGYRWNARQGQKAAFPLGFGLSYTTFTQGALSLKSGKTLTAEVTVTNTGTKAGADVAQIYLVGEHRQRLVGFQKVQLAPGESRKLNITLEPRIIANWTAAGWHIAGGQYAFAVGESAEALGVRASITLAEKTWRP